MEHWSEHYIGIPHTRLDCAELVELALREQFGLMVSFPRKQRKNLFHRAELITRHRLDFAYPISAPVDGCGVLMLARGRMAHMGLYCALAQGHVLHSDSVFGASVRTPINRLVLEYRIEGFYGWR